MTAMVSETLKKGEGSTPSGGFGRACRYFVRQAEVYMLCAIAGGFAMAVYIWLLNNCEVGFMEMLKSFPNAGACAAMIILFTSGISSTQYWYSIPISFGCTRKHAFWGNLLMDMLVIGGTVIFYFITSNLFHADALDLETVFSFAVFLLLEGVSKLIGIAAAKWGKAVYVIMILGVVLFSMSTGFIIGYAGVSGAVLSFSSVFGESLISCGIILGAAAALCIVSNIVSWRIIRVFEVKA